MSALARVAGGLRADGVPFAKRGKRIDACVATTGDYFEFHGEFYDARQKTD